MLSVAIIEDDVQLSACMEHYLESLGQYAVVGAARDGESGLRMVMENVVDVVLVDLALPAKDGFYVLEELAKQTQKKPVCIVLSGMGPEYIKTKAMAAGAHYFVVKPFDLGLLARRIEEIWMLKHTETIPLSSDAINCFDTRSPKNRQDDFIMKVLHKIPISHSLTGYNYLKTAIRLAIDDPKMLEGITKQLYPSVAKQHRTSGPRVERAIRHAIETAWQKGCGQNFIDIVGYGSPDAPKPTNSAFISAIVELYHHSRP